VRDPSIPTCPLCFFFSDSCFLPSLDRPTDRDGVSGARKHASPRSRVMRSIDRPHHTATRRVREAAQPDIAS
jgi:hypothetical protein